MCAVRVNHDSPTLNAPIFSQCDVGSYALKLLLLIVLRIRRSKADVGDQGEFVFVFLRTINKNALRRIILHFYYGHCQKNVSLLIFSK